jgi:hypothetical protein
MDWGRADSAAFGAAITQERIAITQRYQDIIVQMQTQLADGAKDRRELWSMFGEMQKALYKCEQLHNEDARKIEEQERRIKELDEQVKHIRIED